MDMSNGEVHQPPFARCYASQLLRIDSGRGATVRDAAGRRYIDFTAGIAVNALGHGRRDLARVAAREMRRRIHVSNLFATEPAVRLAEELVASGPFDACYFGNSGTEANEAALKFARLYALRTRGEGHHRIVSFTNGFHGRSMGALSATATRAYREPFEPLLPGVEYLPFNDAKALESLDDRVAAIVVEPIQGEGGLDSVTAEFASALNEVCRRYDILMIADEIQSGLGRSGRLYAGELSGLKPDIVTLSKPLAAGLPLSATLIPERVNRLLSPGDHGSTFGGGPVTTAVALRVWRTIREPRFLQRVQSAGERLAAGLERLAASHAIVAGGGTGAGLLRGLKLAVSPEQAKAATGEIMAAARVQGLLILRSGADVLRFAPPLTIADREIERGLDRLDAALETVEREHPEYAASPAKEPATARVSK